MYQDERLQETPENGHNFGSKCWNNIKFELGIKSDRFDCATVGISKPIKFLANMSLTEGHYLIFTHIKSINLEFWKSPAFFQYGGQL